MSDLLSLEELQNHIKNIPSECTPNEIALLYSNSRTESTIQDKLSLVLSNHFSSKNDIFVKRQWQAKLSLNNLMEYYDPWMVITHSLKGQTAKKLYQYKNNHVTFGNVDLAVLQHLRYEDYVVSVYKEDALLFDSYMSYEDISTEEELISYAIDSSVFLGYPDILEAIEKKKSQLRKMWPLALFEFKAHYTFHIADNIELVRDGDKISVKHLQKDSYFLQNGNSISWNKNGKCFIQKIDLNDIFHSLDTLYFQEPKGIFKGKNGLRQDTLKLQRIQVHYPDSHYYQVMIGIHPLSPIPDVYDAFGEDYQVLHDINQSFKDWGDQQNILNECYHHMKSFAKELDAILKCQRVKIGKALGIEWELRQFDTTLFL